MTKSIASAGNTVAPAILLLESLGFAVHLDHDSDRCTARRNGEVYSGSDPVGVLGLVRLVEMRGWDWGLSDEELDDIMKRHGFE